jgi:hypothetical protein
MIKSSKAHKALTYLSKRKYLSLSLVVLSAFLTTTANGQQTDEERIKKLEQRLLDLEQQIEVQKQEGSNKTTHSKAKANSSPKFPKTVQRSSHEFEAPDKSIVLSHSNTTLQIGGQIWLDAIHNNGEMTNRAGFQTSSIAYEKNTNKDKTLLSAGQSKLSFKSYTPTDLGVMTTRFEFDMFDNEGDAAFHLTHLWGELGGFGAGQTFSGFMDINSFPNVLDYWGPNSMVFTRQPQIRYSTAIGDTGKIMFTIEKSSSDFATPRVLPPGIDPNDYDDINELPDITASYFHNGDFGYIKTAIIFRKFGYETANEKDTTVGWGVNVSGSVSVNTDDAIKFQVVHGEGIGRYFNDTCCNYYSDEGQGVAASEATGGVDAGLDGNNSLKGIPITAGFVYYNKQWSKKWSSAIGYSYLEVDNLVSQKAKSIKNSTYASTNLIWYPVSQVKAGIELLYGDIQSRSGLEGDDFRIQTSVGFKY